MSIDDTEKFDLFGNKNSKYLFYKYNDYLTHCKNERFYQFEKKVETERQFLIEKIIHSTEFRNPYKNSAEKNPEIIETVESNYKTSRRIYQALFIDIDDSFIEYMHSSVINEIQELDDDLKVNRWGVKSLLEVENAYEIFTVFQMFYYINGN